MLLRRNFLGFAFFASLLLHGLLLWHLPSLYFSRATAPVPRELELSFSRIRMQTSATTVPGSITPAESREPRPRPPEAAPPPPDQPATPPEEAAENTAAAELPSFGALDLRPPPVRDLPTDTSAHLFDSRLAARIDAARARPRSRSLPSEEASSLADTTRTIGGRQGV